MTSTAETICAPVRAAARLGAVANQRRLLIEPAPMHNGYFVHLCTMGMAVDELPLTLRSETTWGPVPREVLLAVVRSVAHIIRISYVVFENMRPPTNFPPRVYTRPCTVYLHDANGLDRTHRWGVVATTDVADVERCIEYTSAP